MTSRIPPHIARELRRHIKLPEKSSIIASSSSLSQNETSKAKSGILWTFAGVVTFLGITSSIPYFITKWIGPLNERDGPLTSSQIRRGAFNNSGSKDVGKDPMWDFSTGTRIKDEAYKDLFLKDDPTKVDHGDVFISSSKRG